MNTSEYKPTTFDPITVFHPVIDYLKDKQTSSSESSSEVAELLQSYDEFIKPVDIQTDSRKGDEVSITYSAKGQPIKSESARLLIIQLLKYHAKAQGWPELINLKKIAINDSEQSDFDNSVNIMSFNMLADNLSGNHPQLGNFIGPPVECLKWYNRKWRLLLAILEVPRDVMCFQEMDEEHYHTFFGPVLSLVGYSSVYRPKCTPVMAHSDARDGCMIATKLSLSLANVSSLAFPNANQVLLYVELEWRGVWFTCATTHLKAAKTEEGETLREAQVKEIIRTLGDKEHVVLCGDFNALARPTEHVLYESRAVPAALKAFTSAHQFYEGGEAPYTTIKTRKGGCLCHTIDYIMTRGAQPTALSCVPSVDSLPAFGLPHWMWPSDHIAIEVWLQFNR